MQPAEGAPRQSLFPLWTYVASGVLLAVGLLLFFQSRDAMLLIFAVMASGMLFFFLVLARYLAQGSSAGRVMVRCDACRGLNPEDARFCNQCGKAL